MSPNEARRLLAVASGFDSRTVDEVQTRAWYLALREYEFAEAEEAIVAHFTDPATRRQYITHAHVLDRLEDAHRHRRDDVETDVRVAKARGILDASWPANQPLDAATADALATLRQRDLREIARYEALALGEAPAGWDGEVGVTLREP